LTYRLVVWSLLLAIAVALLFSGALPPLRPAKEPLALLENVRAYAAPLHPDGEYYAISSGRLYRGAPLYWIEVTLPSPVIAASIALDAAEPGTVYVGAANELSLYRSRDRGDNWQRIPLRTDVAGGVTTIAVDSSQRLIYAGSDTAGLFRLRDVGSTVVLSAQLLLDEPVVEVVAGDGLAFARTGWRLYRAEEYGLRWLEVDNLQSAPTALALAATQPPTLYVGTIDRGILESNDGLTWRLSNQGLPMLPGTRMHVDALAVDPAQPEYLYTAVSYLHGSTQLHRTASRVAMRYRAMGAGAVGSGEISSWTTLQEQLAPNVAELLPISGHAGALYVLTTTSRTLLALGSAPAAIPADFAEAETANPTRRGQLLAWLFAALAALALFYALAYDLRTQRLILHSRHEHKVKS
jgi:hypothetical protein